ncbi:helix-turn-helix domain-containing protein [Streptosporangium sp. NPDC006007]|uniref:TetR/AcrR family transcriptional regulator n=1 Tax=Streptosporangium sp. NPDC006007 TaxID=3154575 RepID=UPI0033A131B2
MGEVPGLRERKKLRTRRALTAAALRLFMEKGYEQTTVSEIAMTADVSTRTFFSYFASKEEVLLFNSRENLGRVLRTVAERRSGESAADLLARAVGAVFDVVSADAEIEWEIASVNHLIMTVPSLRAHALLLLFDTQREMAEALHRACPDELDLVEAAAAVGGVVGAVKLAGFIRLNRGAPPAEVMAACRRAAEMALAGLRAISTPPA